MRDKPEVGTLGDMDEGMFEEETPVAQQRQVAMVRAGGSSLQAREQVGGLLRPVAPVHEVLEAQEETRTLIEKALKEGRDYDTITGTSKKTLLKPGAERTSAAFGCVPLYHIVDKEVDHDREVSWTKTKWVTTKPRPDDWEAIKAKGEGRNKQFSGTWVWQEKHDEQGTSLGLYRYVIQCDLVHRASGVVIGSGIGSCSTMEDKYIDRPRDLENTALKMAQKRALVGATLNAFGMSDQFTQDVEDNPEVFRRGGAGSSAPPKGDSGDSGNGGDAPSGSNPGIWGENLHSKKDFLEHQLRGSKKKGQTWRQLIDAGGDDRGFVHWAVGDGGKDGIDSIPEKHRKWLREAMDEAKDKEEGGEQVEAQEAQEDQPRTPILTATTQQRAELKKYIKDPRLPEKVGDTLDALLAMGEFLTQAKASNALQQLADRLGPPQQPEASMFDELDDGLPF